MSKKVFTKKEMEMLRNNPYTYSVSKHCLSFTKEFKELFWEEYQQGNAPRQILEKYGYPADLLGSNRIQGITQCIKNQYYSQKGIHQGTARRIDESNTYTEDTPELRKLNAKIIYLQQEIEFIKKIISIRTSGK